MRIRIISAVLGLCVLFPVLWFSDTIVFPIALALCAALAAYEICNCVGAKEWYTLASSVTFAALGVVLTRFVAPSVKGYIALLAMMAFLYLFLLLSAAVLSGGKVKYSSVAEAVIAVVYATVGFASVALVRRLTNGEVLFGMIFLGAWMTDTMAYFSGRLFGKHKLCYLIAPQFLADHENIPVKLRLTDDSDNDTT